jgi:hypothetical protein
MKLRNRTVVLAGLVLGTNVASAQFSIQPLSTFSPNNDGWLTIAEDSFLTTGSTERGMAFNPTNNHLYIASRGNTTNGTSVQILNATTGAVLGNLNTTGISGGTAALNCIGVTADGAIYTTNLTINTQTQAGFKVYRWSSELATPQALTLDLSALQAQRLGDNLDVFGSESDGSVRLSLGYNGGAGYQLVNTTALTTSFVNVGTPTGFRGGIAFVDNDTIWGTAGGTTTGGITRTETNSTLSGTSNLTALPERQLDIINVAGMWLMATVEVGSSTTDQCDVRIYDITNSVVNGAAGITLLGTANLVTPPFVNNGTGSAGSVQWGTFDGSDIELYAMSTNNGIQAFNVHVVPEPSCAFLAAVGLLSIAGRRRRSSNMGTR